MPTYRRQGQSTVDRTYLCGGSYLPPTVLTYLGQSAIAVAPGPFDKPNSARQHVPEATSTHRRQAYLAVIGYASYHCGALLIAALDSQNLAWMNTKLKQLNFNDLLIIDTDIDNYNFDIYLSNTKHLIKGFCTKCEEKGVNSCPTDSSYRLQNISHGATSEDFLIATNQIGNDMSDWKNDGVLFLMEGPSNDKGFYEKNEFNGFSKKPTKEWYWIHNKQQAHQYPQEFRGGRYGSLFNSILFTFKLKNAYLTNFVKCGLNNDKNNYQGIEKYNWDCVKTCVDNYLYKEIEYVDAKVVYCFGSSVYWKLHYLYEGKFPFVVVDLPHPAGQRRGFKDEYYRHLYFTKILEGLYSAGIYIDTGVGL